VHTTLSLISLFSVTFGSFLALGSLHYLRSWSQRRRIQCFILAAPLLCLIIDIGELCLLSAFSWNTLLSVVLRLSMVFIALGAFGLGLVRLALMARFIARQKGAADPELQALAESLAQRLDAPCPRVLLCASERPLALTYGLFRATMLLSTWMLDTLDQRELEAVLAHELAHIARRDYLVTWLATILRDAFFYLPTSRIAYRRLQAEKELACDDLVVSATQRPLALASALARVWLHAVEPPRLVCIGTAQTIEGAGESLKGRIERLLAHSASPASAIQPRAGRLPTGISTITSLLMVQAISTILLLLVMGCGSMVLFG
jgi:beta-lactamase regulating signal transducer with metallopeptidase domain